MESISQPNRPSEVTSILSIGFSIWVNAETDPTVTLSLSRRWKEIQIFNRERKGSATFTAGPLSFSTRSNSCSQQVLEGIGGGGWLMGGGEFQLPAAFFLSQCKDKSLVKCKLQLQTQYRSPFQAPTTMSTFQLKKLLLLLKINKT